MSELTFRRAERRKARLRMGLAGPAGSGKTLSSLLIAYGLTEDWAKIGLIDTENGSGDLYVGTEVNGVKIDQYNVLTLTAPFTPERYMAAIHAGERAGLEVIIIDSLSHAWAGEGGLLDQHGTLADKSGNSFAAWRQITPKHNALVEAILGSPCHIIATMRAKTEYVQTEENGKKVVKKLGLAPVQRDGMEYEFTLFCDIDAQHRAYASKDRTGLFDGMSILPTPEMGRQLRAWLEQGVDAPTPATDEQRKLLASKAKDKGISAESMTEMIRQRYGAESSKQLTFAQAAELIAELEAMPR